jgi:hypothetical protein
MFFNDFVDVFLIDIGVPDFFRIDHDDWAFIAPV